MTVQGCRVGFQSDDPLHRIRRNRMDYGFASLTLRNPHWMCEGFSQDTVLFNLIEISAIAGGVTLLTAPGPVGRTARFFGLHFYTVRGNPFDRVHHRSEVALGRVRPPRAPRREANVILDEKIR